MRYWARAVAVASVGVGVAGCASAPPPSGVVTPPPTLDQQITACSAIDDMTKDRLDCFDAIPVPPPGPAAAIVIVQCRAVTEQDARLRCFDKLLIAPPTPATAGLRARSTATHYVRRGRGGCGSRGGAGYRLPNGKCASRRR